MIIKEVVEYLIKQFPLKIQEEWDQSGIIVEGQLNQKMENAIICLEVNDEIIDEALRKKASLIISHHPIFKQTIEHKINDYNAKLLHRISDNQMTLLSLHTNYDFSNGGMNYEILNKIDCQKINWFDNDKNNKFLVAKLKQPMTLNQLAIQMRLEFELENVYYLSSDGNKKISNIALCAGSGFSVFEDKIDEIKKSNIDLIITGDIKWHNWQLSKNYNIALLDVSHAIENSFVDAIYNLISSKFKKTKFHKMYTDLELTKL